MKALLLVVVLAGIVTLPSHAGPPTRKKITAGPVVVTGNGLSGSFEVTENPSGIPSTGTGGACLVLSKDIHGGPACRTDSDCALDPQSLAVGGHAYCLAPGGVLNAFRKKRCWIRPGAPGTHCRLSKQIPQPLDQTLAFPVDAAGNLQPLPAPQPGWWRVHACLNGQINGACGDPANPDRMFSDGPPKKIP